MKPIEKGCLAMVVGCSVASNNGMIVTVGDFKAGINYVNQQDFLRDVWEINKVVIAMREDNLEKRIKVSLIPGEFLVRIDGFEPTEQDVMEEELLLEEQIV